MITNKLIDSGAQPEKMGFLDLGVSIDFGRIFWILI